MFRNRFRMIICILLALMLLPGISVSAASNNAGPVRIAQDIGDTETPTATLTETAIPTETETPTATDAVTATETSTEPATATEPATVTPTATPSATETVTVTETATATETATPTATATTAPSNRYVAPSGVDAGNCDSVAAPCATINYAIGQAASGNTIYVALGTYIGTGPQVVLINKAIALSGGWNANFTVQSGLSVVTGQSLRRVITVTGSPVLIKNFDIQFGFNSNSGGGINNSGILTINNSVVSNNLGQDGGGGINNLGVLTINNSVVSDNIGPGRGGGIFNLGTLTITNSTIKENRSGVGASGYDGGGGISNSGTLIISNSTLSGNKILGSFAGAAIFNVGTATLNNTTVTGNTGSSAIYGQGGRLTINNSTITNNTRGIGKHEGFISLQNSILAGNTLLDCAKTIKSNGYNLVGNSTGCTVLASTGDQIGTEISPIDPRLGPLQNYGGSTFTHALLNGSPALGAGSPAVPGSGENACLAKDQRGYSRLQYSPCDIGAYESSIPLISSIQRSDPSPNAASQVNFKVVFSENVTGVDKVAPFNDFSLTTTGLTGASIAAVSGSGNTYIVTVKTGNGNGSIRLNLIDHDSIKDASGTPLGFKGVGNGNYNGGQTYSIITISTLSSPVGQSWDKAPKYVWSAIVGATQYQYQLFKGATFISSKIVNANSCGAAACSDSPTTTLTGGTYQWRVRAMVAGAWKNFSAYKTFTVLVSKAGFWHGGSDFYVTPDNANIINYTIYITVYECNIYDQKLVINAPIPITKQTYRYNNAQKGIYLYGEFKSITTGTGSLELHNYYLAGCGYINGGDYVSHIWKNSSQPTAGNTSAFTLLPVAAHPGSIFTLQK